MNNGYILVNYNHIMKRDDVPAEWLETRGGLAMIDHHWEMLARTIFPIATQL